MRLIDKDALVQELDDKEIPYNAEIGKIIWEAPVIEERKKGKWIIEESLGYIFRSIYFVCPFCRNTLDRDRLNAGRGDANFCPNCGAELEMNT